MLTELEPEGGLLVAQTLCYQPKYLDLAQREPAEFGGRADGPVRLEVQLLKEEPRSAGMACGSEPLECSPRGSER